MSVKVMAAIWERYPSGAGELVLALALADHAHDDGTHIWPKIATLAKKTRQSERTVQYQLRKMEADGFIVLLNQGKGGRNLSREYAINLDWINGVETAPLDAVEMQAANAEETASFVAEKGANHEENGCNLQQETVQSTTQKSAIAVAPANNRHSTIKEPSEKHKAKWPKGDSVRDPFVGFEELVAEGVDRAHAIDWLTVRKTKKLPLTPTAWLATKREAAKAGLTAAQAVQRAAESGWARFEASFLDNARAVPASNRPPKFNPVAFVNNRNQPNGRTDSVIDV